MPKKEPVFSITHQGTVVSARFKNGEKGGGETITLDVAALPEAQHLSCLLEGAKSFLRMSYVNANRSKGADALLKERVNQLLSGRWLPGHRKIDVEPDDLARAVTEAVHISFSEYNESFLPNWLRPGRLKYHDGTAVVTATTTRDGKSRIVGKERALTLLRERPEIAPILARLAAERARTAKAHKTPGPNLADFTSSPATAAAAAAE
jgi:hypothetical protein